MEQELIIEAGRTERQYWKDLWRYRELIYFLSWRDILVRYKQTVIGILWAVLRPLLTMLAFTFVFGKIAKLPSEGEAPYAIMVFAAMLPWQFFATSLSESANSLVANANLVSKVYFPRILVPSATLVVNAVDFCISFVLLGGLMIWYGFMPSAQIFAILPLLLLTSVLALGPGLLLCALTVTYRDFRYVIPFIVQFGLYVSPVGFSSSVVPDQWQFLYSLNPMVGIIDGFRWAILGGSADFPTRAVAISCVAALLLLLLGIRYFRSTEQTFADVI
ncbi:ABC transporter permease [Desulfocurvibacter africanus]|uniref:ABC transporter permease n=1 Tax=Desulfocurvibacter africanus TaxID=873 RepID=UPI0004152E67|nr:ABC transporter permease [Desulfocurvibacter africanus]